MLSDDYGQTWNSGWDISGNAVVNSLATITLKFLQGYGMYMRFGDVNSNYIEVAPYSDQNDNPMGVSFDGSGNVRFQPQGEFEVRNIDSSNNLYNYQSIKRTSTQSRIAFENYWYNDTQYMANYLSMISNSSNNGITLQNREMSSNDIGNMITMNNSPSNGNQLVLRNRSVSADYDANLIWCKTTTSEHYLKIDNYDVGANQLANEIILDSTSTLNSLKLENRWNNSVVNSIEMGRVNSGGSMIASTTIWSDNDLRLYSSGAVRINANTKADGTSSYNNQDIHLTGVTIHCYFSSKFSYHLGSQRYDVDSTSLSGMSVGDYAPLYVHRVS